MSTKILILGRGYMGHRLQEGLSCSVTEQRINSLADAQKVLADHKPKILINAIGFTGGGSVDGCESNLEKTIFANAFVPLLLAEACLRRHVKLVHISSGCIYHFDYKRGQRPITEMQTPDYFDLYYSRTKIYSEQPLVNLSRAYNILITRIRIPLDDRPHPKNILSKLIQYKRVIDIPNSVTYVPDFIAALKHLLKSDARDLYNVVNKGTLRYPQLLKRYQKHVPEFQFETISYQSLKMNRTNLALSCRKLESSGFKMRPIKAVLEEAITGFLRGSNN